MKKTRCIFSVMMVLCMLLVMVPLPGRAAEYVAYGACGTNLAWSIDTDGTFTISGTGRMNLDDRTIPWSNYEDDIKKVVIGEGITSIGINAFASCENLTSVSIPDTVTEIESMAFTYCRSLKTITLPDSLEVLAGGAFQNSALESIVIPGSLAIIRDSTFDSCDLVNVVIEEGVTEIEARAFAYCKNLQSVTIPSTVKKIGYMAFYRCSKLKDVYISDMRAYIDMMAKNEYHAMDSYLSLSGSNKNLYLNGELVQELVIPVGVAHIPAECFHYSITSLVIPSSVKSLGINCFSACRMLETIYFRGDAPEFDIGVFSWDTATVYYPAGTVNWKPDEYEMTMAQLTWVPYEHSHHYEGVITEPTCTEAGYTTYICGECGDGYFADKTVPRHRWSEGTCVQPRICTACGEASGKVHGHLYEDSVDGSCEFCDVPRQDIEIRQVVHMFRMYNPNTGEHFYTGSEEERDNLIGYGWQYEGVGFTFPANTGAPVYRLFHEPTGEHLYTMDKAEKEKLEAEGWNYEGIAFNSAYNTEAVQHRLHNPNATVGAYHFTFSLEEKQNLIDAGWEYQGIGWYSCWK